MGPTRGSRRCAAGTQIPQRTLVRTRSLDGSPGREVEVSGVATTFGGRAAIQAVMRDVTEERRAERARADSEARLSAIVHTAMDAVVTLDDAMRIVLVNEAAESLFGYTAAELVGQSVEVLVPPALRERHAQLVAAFVARDAAPTRMGARAIRGLHKDGTEIPLEASIARTRVGGRDEYTVVHRDLRKQLAADRARDESDERFRQLTEAIREVFWMTDVAEDRLLYVSPAYATIFGRSVAERYARPRSWLDAVHLEDRPRVLDALPSQALGHYDLEYRVALPDGTVRWIHDRAFPVRADDGTVVRIAGVAEDMTGRRTLEDGLRQAQRMESLGRLAGGIAHDFNNLLTVAITAAELVREEPTVSDEGRELLASMLEVGRRGTSLTRQLLAFSREELVEPRVMELGEVVADTQKLLVRVIGEDVRVRTRIDPDHTPVRIDPGQWSQVLLNLAINARDAMPGGGELDIATGRAQLDTSEAVQRGVSPGTYASSASAIRAAG